MLNPTSGSRATLWVDASHKIYQFFFSSRRRHTRLVSDWSSDVCSSDLEERLSDCAQVSSTPMKQQSKSSKIKICWARVSPSFARLLIYDLALSTRHYYDNCREIGRASCRERV